MTIRDKTTAFGASGNPGASAGDTAGISQEGAPGSSHEELLRLVNGVIWPGFSGRTLPEWLDGALHDGLAGVVYFSQNIDPADPAQPARLSTSGKPTRSR